MSQQLKMQIYSYSIIFFLLKLIIVCTGLEKYPLNREIFDPKMYTYSFVSISKRCFLSKWTSSHLVFIYLVFKYK